MALKRAWMFSAGLAAAALALAAGAGAADRGPYVALGDSYTAGPFVLNQTGRPAGCMRSDHNYPSIVAAALGAGDFSDVSCSSAETKHMTSPQAVSFGVNPPQLDALRDATRLVTVGIGGNDAGLVGAAVKCVFLGLTAPTGTACRDHFAPAGDDSLTAAIARTAPRIAALLQAIHERSPHARVALVGYPAVAPRSGNGCYPVVPLSPDDLRYLDSLLVRLNTMLAEQAAATGAEFVDTYSDSIGHDVCTLPTVKWFEGVVPTALAYPVHPNALGMQGIARSVLRVLGGPPPAPVLSALSRARRTIARGRSARFGYHLDRPATVAAVLRRAVAGRLAGATCERAAATNRGGRECHRYVVARRLSFAGSLGDNRLTLAAKDYGRRAGLYRLTATPAAGGTEQLVHFRVKR